MNLKNVKMTKLNDNDLIEANKSVGSFLKYLSSEYEKAKSLEVENS